MGYREINSSQNEYIKELAKLKHNKIRHVKQLALIEGLHLISSAYDNNLLVEILVTKDNLHLVNQYQNVNIIIVTDQIIRKLSTSVTSQPILGIINLAKYFSHQKIDYHQNALILENIQDPGNLGTLLRTSFGFNFPNVFLVHNGVDLFNDKVIRASQGALFYLNIHVISHPVAEFLVHLKKEQYQIISTNLSDNSTFLETTTFAIDQKYAVCLGNEGSGLSPMILDNSDLNVKIKINVKLDSLNVAQAGTILMYEINKQQKGE
ncbi:TrmH family RNA methyltransferase [Spiroplasma eriocheiris]|uniref:RNA methyltransferase, TrmH family n=1 Tax=Spiroplasma eriocheiris TaxID=315358 RepID=A0A0H3XIV8_9MOLU|nr:RNA methyltransferase [Spiroplasma eriocheiris]AHF58003.1 rRNA methylase [Spiroplasma eriocheiris CCTCC M 207170]AKM54445.1 RNA methyltransferase, TrmH family [Spiroplasma eriocheiris]